MRADLYLFTAGHTKSRQQAKNLIEAGLIRIDGNTVSKPSEEINGELTHEVTVLQKDIYVSRGGLKLEAALDAFGIDVRGMRALDIGASTGGFTDCLLQHGAVHITAVDSGSGQLDKKLIDDSRITSIEKFNARRLTEGDISEIPSDVDIAVMDVSFISQTYIIPGLHNILRDGGYYIGLIKPQFEAGHAAIGKNGIVKDIKYHFLSIKRVIECAFASGFGCLGVIISPIEGGDGNTEYLAAFKFGDRTPLPADGELLKLIRTKR